MEIIKNGIEMKYYNNNLDIYVINLDYRKEKFEKIKNEFSEKDIKLIRFNAINGKTLCENYIDMYSNINLSDGINSQIYKFYNKCLRYGEVGCFLSHTTLWHSCIAYNMPYIIVAEDDILKTNDFSFENIRKALNELNNNISTKNWDILFLSKTKDKSHNKYNMGFKYKLNGLEYKYNDKYEIEQSEENKLKYVSKLDPRCGLHFYIITQDACRRCLEQCNIISAPIDVQIWDNHKGLNSFILNEGLVDEDITICDTYSNSLLYTINEELLNIICVEENVDVVKETKSYHELFSDGYMYLQINELKNAIICYLKCIQINVFEVNPYLYLVELIIKDGLKTGTFNFINNLFETCCNLHMENNIKNSSIYCATARLFEFQDNLEKTLEYYFKALEIDSENPIIIYNVGLTIAKSQTNTWHCLGYFDKCLKINPNFEECYKSLITYYNRNKNFDELYELTEFAYNKFGSNYFLYEYAKACMNKPDFNSSITCFDGLIKRITSNDKNSILDINEKYMLASSYIKLSIIYKWLDNDYESKKYIFKVLDKLDYYYDDYKNTYEAKQKYGELCLYNKEYIKGFKYYKYGHDYFNKLDTAYVTFFKKNDKNKTLLLFNCGGYGDLIMYSRFIEKVAKIYNENKILFIIDRKLKWMFNYKNCSNVICICESNAKYIVENKHIEYKFDYYCDIFNLSYFLNLQYENIYFEPYLNNMLIRNNYECTFFKQYIEKYRNSFKKIIAFNWHGNRSNGLDKWQRGINLKDFERLFNLQNVLWVNLQKEKNNEEDKYLKSFSNVLDLTNDIDKNEKAFYDTIDILKNVDMCISTDTSLLHLSSTLNIKTIGLISKCCEWRWTRDTNTIWYPNILIFKQLTLLKWKDTLDLLRKHILNTWND